LEKLKSTFDVDVYWRSYQLRPPGSPPIPPEYRARIAQADVRLNQIARDSYGLKLNRGPFGIDSRPALIGEKYAESQGNGDAYHDLVQDAYWQGACAIDDIDVLKELAASAGLDPDEFEVALKKPEYEASVEADIQQAYEFGLSGVPALIFENKYLVSGAQPYDVLQRVVSQIEGEMQGSTGSNAAPA
jgi:predicted DsbA family dithiol-disulfide isomerase